MGKSSRKSRAGNAGPRPARAPPCLHGADPASALQREAFDGLVKGLQISLMQGGSFSAGLIAAMQELTRLGIMDQKMVAYVVAQGVNMSKKRQGKDVALAGLCCMMSITMGYWLQVGGEEFTAVVQTTDPRSRQPFPWFQEWNVATTNIVTERDVIRSLAKRIPCDCLGEAKAEHKKDPKIKWCHKCGNSELKSALMTCARCGMKYCSQKCQVEDWPEHKSFCLSVAKPSSSGK